MFQRSKEILEKVKKSLKDVLLKKEADLMLAEVVQLEGFLQSIKDNIKKEQETEGTAMAKRAEAQKELALVLTELNKNTEQKQKIFHEINNINSNMNSLRVQEANMQKRLNEVNEEIHFFERKSAEKKQEAEKAYYMELNGIKEAQKTSEKVLNDVTIQRNLLDKQIEENKKILQENSNILRIVGEDKNKNHEILKAIIEERKNIEELKKALNEEKTTLDARIEKQKEESLKVKTLTERLNKKDKALKDEKEELERQKTEHEANRLRLQKDVNYVENLKEIEKLRKESKK